MKKTSIILSLIALVAVGCSTPPPPQVITRIQPVNSMEPFIPDPGAVEYIYEQPMVDVIDVPPGLDPEGVYYRPQHQEIVEVRQGRWNYYRKDK